jgi:hypothetical protein
MRDWTKENKRNPPVQFRVTRAEFAELRSAGWKRRPRLSPHLEAKRRVLDDCRREL